MAWKSASDAYFNYGNFLVDSKLLKTARVHFELAHAAARKAGDSIREGRARHGLGDVLMIQCRFEDATNQYLRDAALLERFRIRFTIARQHYRIVFGHFCVCDILLYSLTHTHTHNAHTTGTNDKSGTSSSMCGETSTSGRKMRTDLTCTEVRKDRARVLRRARVLYDLRSENKQSFEDVERFENFAAIFIRYAMKSTMIVEKITTSELRLHVQCLESRAGTSTNSILENDEAILKLISTSTSRTTST